MEKRRMRNVARHLHWVVFSNRTVWIYVMIKTNFYMEWFEFTFNFHGQLESVVCAYSLTIIIATALTAIIVNSLRKVHWARVKIGVGVCDVKFSMQRFPHFINCKSNALCSLSNFSRRISISFVCLRICCYFARGAHNFKTHNLRSIPITWPIKMFQMRSIIGYWTKFRMCYI